MSEVKVPYRPRLVAAIVATGGFMAGLDGTVITVAVPKMAAGFDVPVVNLSLGVVIYILVFAAVLPATSWISDRLGCRRVLIYAIAGFTLTSVLCGMSQSLEQFIAARAAQGTAAALMTSVGGLILLRATAKKDLVTVMGISTAAALMAPVIGPPLGGFIIAVSSWPWVFFINIPLGLLGVALVYGFIPDVEAPPVPRFDWKGFFLAATAMSAIIFGFDLLGTGGSKWYLALLTIALGLVAGAFLLRHGHRCTQPLIPIDALRIPTFRAMVLEGGGIVKIPYRAMGFVLPLLFQVGFGMTAFQAGLLLLAYNGGDIILKPLANPILRRTGFRSALVSGAWLTAAATLALVLLTPHTPFAVSMIVMTLSGMARSVMLTGVVALTFADVPKEELAGAAVLNNLGNQVTGALGVSLSVIAINLTATVRGLDPEAFGVFECHVAIIVMTVLGASALYSFLRLSPHAGAHIIRPPVIDGSGPARILSTPDA